MSRHRDALLLALGSPEEPDAKAALAIVLESLQAEASALADSYTSKLTGARQIALSCRLEALKKFVDEYVTVKWAEGGAS